MHRKHKSRPFLPRHCKEYLDGIDVSPTDLGIEGRINARYWRKIRHKLLAGHGEEADRVAGRIEQCSTADPCESAACPTSMRFPRGWFVMEGFSVTVQAAEALGYPKKEICLNSLSVIHPGTRLALGKLRVKHVTRLFRKLRHQLKKAGFGHRPIVGALDISLNELSDHSQPPYWQLHVYLVTPCLSDPDLAHRLREQLPSDSNTPRPLKVQTIGDPRKAFSYAVKSVFYRRVSYIDARGRKNTRKLPLRPDQERELLIFLDKLGFARRLFLFNVRRRGLQLKYEPGSKAVIRDRLDNHEDSPHEH